MANLARLNVELNLIDNFSSKLQGVQKNVGKIGQSLMGAGKTMTAAVTLPLAAFAGFSVAQATDVEESVNKINEVFGGNAERMLDWSKDSATAFGLSRGEALAAAGTLGNLFKGVGVGSGLIDNFSQDIVQAAADLGSFNNASPQEVLDALQSGLVGEAEPLRKFGILLNESAVQSKALELGLADSNGELSEGAKVQARYALIMEQLGDAQGDFARTSDGLANKTRILKAQFKDIAAEIGSALLPFVTKLANGIGVLLGWFRRLPTPIVVVMFFLAGLAAAAGPVLVILGAMASGLSALIGLFAATSGALLPVLGVLGLFAAAGAAFFVAWQLNIFGLRDRLTEFASDVMRVFDRLRGEGVNPVNAAIRAFGSALEDLTGIEMSDFFFNLARAVDNTILRIQIAAALIGPMVDEINTDFELAITAIRASLSEAVDVMDRFTGKLIVVGVTVLGWALSVGAAFTLTLAVIKLTWDKAVGVVETGAALMVIAITPVVQAFQDLRTAIAFIALKIDGWADAIGAGIDKIAEQSRIDKLGGLLSTLQGIADVAGFAIDDPFGFLDVLITSSAPGAAAEGLERGAADIPNVQVPSLRFDISTIEQLVIDIENQFVRLRNSAVQLTESLRDKVESTFSDMRHNVSVISEGVKLLSVGWFEGMQTKLTTIAENTAIAVEDQFVRMRNSTVQLAGSLVSGVLSELSALPLAGFGIGESLGIGIAAGIRGTIGVVAAEAASLVENAITAARVAADARSPSRKMMALGNDLVAGLMLPLVAGRRPVGNAMAGLIAAPRAPGGGAGLSSMSSSSGLIINNYGTINVPSGYRDVQSAIRADRVGSVRP